MTFFRRLRNWLARIEAWVFEAETEPPFSVMAMQYPAMAFAMDDPVLTTKEHIEKLSRQFDLIFEDFENIKLEQQRYSYFTETLGDQISELKSENALIKKDLAVCMRLIKHQHNLINSVKLTTINPSRN